MRPLLIGEMPSRSGDRYWELPLSGAVAETMCKMAGIPPDPDGSRYGKWTWALYEHFECINAIERHGPWDSERAARRLIQEIKPAHEVVVLLGRRAQTAYVRMSSPATTNLAGLGFHRWRIDMLSDTGRRQVAVIPHPSTRNQMNEHPAIRIKSGLILREAIEKAKQLEETYF